MLIGDNCPIIQCLFRSIVFTIIKQIILVNAITYHTVLEESPQELTIAIKIKISNRA